MPLPTLLRAHVAERENAREFAKQAILTGNEAAAAAAVGAPLEAVREHPVAKRMLAAVPPREQAQLQESYSTTPSLARAALESRDGRAQWLAGVVTGEVKFEGAFGSTKPFPPNVRLRAAQLLGLMHGDYVVRTESHVSHEVTVFKIPDNGRLPDELVVEAKAE